MMELLLSVILPLLCFSARLASAATTHVFVYDTHAQDKKTVQQSRDLSITDARLILAQRAGVDQYHDLGDAASSSDIAQVINDYGTQRSLFGQQPKTNRALLLVEDCNLPYDDLLDSLRSYRSFAVPAAPAMNETGGLFVDIARQADLTVFAGVEEHSIPTYLAEKQRTNLNGDIYHIMRSVEHTRGLFQELAASGKYDITVIVTPADSASHDYIGEPASNWGTYEMPNARSYLRKREQHESTLEEFSRKQTFETVASFYDSAENASEPLPGILPACFPSQSACESATRNCTGHGSCALQYVNEDTQAKSPFKNCYGCQCRATVEERERGKKTTVWGGPACQKKDVSTPFWLLFLFTVGMLSVVGFAIGQIWGMGEQELPSVIGAGVSGPVRR